MSVDLMQDNSVKVQRTFLNTLEQECHNFIQSPKFPSYLFKLQEVKERFHALTPEQKHQYFINVDEKSLQLGMACKIIQPKRQQ